MNAGGVDNAEGGRPLQRSALAAALDAFRPKITATISPTGRTSFEAQTRVSLHTIEGDAVAPGRYLFQPKPFRVSERAFHPFIVGRSSFVDRMIRGEDTEFFIKTRCEPEGLFSFLWKPIVDRQIEAEKRFRAGISAIRANLNPKRDRSAIRREARSSVLIPGTRGPARKVESAELVWRPFKEEVSLVGRYPGSFFISKAMEPVLVEGEARVAALSRWIVALEHIRKTIRQTPRIIFRDGLFGRPSTLRCGLSALRSEILSTVPSLVYEEQKPPVHEGFSRAAVAKIIGRCRIEYTKFLSWKTSFDRTEVITLIRRLDFRGIGSIKIAYLPVMWSLVPTIRSDYARDFAFDR